MGSARSLGRVDPRTVLWGFLYLWEILHGPEGDVNRLGREWRDNEPQYDYSWFVEGSGTP
jgi:hypothetical protein